ncbi:DinB family protein [Ascidiimonas sp. W6]|uniref:DinB family protein n=1 Tax=Ascidiimonas meishanensis TaxID=3128903 RepID=UPI0030EF4AD1
MKAEISQITTLRSKEHLQNANVSSVNIAWHLDHIFLTINSVYETVKTSDPNNYKSAFNLPKLILFTTKHIPRGQAKSSDKIRPQGAVTSEILDKHMETALSNLALLDSLPKNSNFTHPYFGQLHREDAKRFLKIHTQHHLKICRDILKASNE